MTEIPRNWVATGFEFNSSHLPPATPFPSRFGLESCHEENHKAMVCTRLKGHTGRHAASGMRQILAVWE